MVTPEIVGLVIAGWALLAVLRLWFVTRRASQPVAKLAASRNMELNPGAFLTGARAKWETDGHEVEIRAEKAGLEGLWVGLWLIRASILVTLSFEKPLPFPQRFKLKKKPFLKDLPSTIDGIEFHPKPSDRELELLGEARKAAIVDAFRKLAFTSIAASSRVTERLHGH